MKIVILLLLLSLQLLATQYNSTIFELEAKLFPKIVLLNKDINKTTAFLNLYILTTEVDRDSAEEFKEIIEFNYPHKIRNKQVIVSVKQFPDIVDLPDAVIVLNHTEEQLKKIANWANKNRVISFAYDPSYLNYGILCSLYIGISTKPYLNREIVKKYKFTFSPYLLELSKFK